MTNRVAFVLAVIILAYVVLDAFFMSGAQVLFLLRQLSALIEWIAFWR